MTRLRNSRTVLLRLSSPRQQIRPPDIATLSHDGLLTQNPNQYSPLRLKPSEALTCDQNHGYGPEQQAYNNGAMDQFVQKTSVDTCKSADNVHMFGKPGLVMGYYDGNTVAGMWNLAQNYAMSDHAFSTQFGPSTPPALNLIAGSTHGARSYDAKTGQQTATPDKYAVQSPDGNGVGTVTNDPDPLYDDCSNHGHNLAALDGKNVGDLLNAKSVSWGWFQGGFAPSKAHDGDQLAVCGAAHNNVGGFAAVDYSPHHNPFAYYKSTANPTHAAPANDAEIGHDGAANHNYDLTDFDKVVNSDNMPAVSYLKAGEYQDGHAAYSDPVDEQNFITKQINKIQASKNWANTAIVLAYDDSDGWYDHVPASITNGSNDAAGANLDAEICKGGPAPAGGYQDRCGPGTRQPLLVVSPYAKKNFVDHTQTDQASILKFIEQNWSLGQIGDSSVDESAGQINAMFDFNAAPRVTPVVLDEKNGSVVQTAVQPSSPAPSSQAPSVSAPAGQLPVTSASPSSSAAGEDLAATGFPVVVVGMLALIVAAFGVLTFVLIRRRKRFN